jgi:hypothetical protein
MLAMSSYQIVCANVSHHVVSSTPRVGFELTTLGVISTDCIGSQLPYDHYHDGLPLSDDFQNFINTCCTPLEVYSIQHDVIKFVSK